MTCRVCGILFMKGCTDVTKLIYKYDHFTRQKTLRIFTYPTSNRTKHKGRHNKGQHHHKLEPYKRSYHDLKQYYGAQSEDQIVIVTQCGHLFHKGCLREFIVTSRRTQRKSVADCPVCLQKVILSSAIEVDIRILNGLTGRTDKHMERAIWMHKELLKQVERYQLSIDKIETTAREECLGRFKQAKVKSKHLDKEMHCRNVVKSEHSEMKDSMGKQVKCGDSYREEFRGIIGFYLNMVSQDSFPKRCIDKRIPKELIPYLSFITRNDTLLEKFIEISFPFMPNEMTFSSNIEIQEFMEEILHEITKVKAEEEHLALLNAMMQFNPFEEPSEIINEEQREETTPINTRQLVNKNLNEEKRNISQMEILVKPVQILKSIVPSVVNLPIQIPTEPESDTSTIPLVRKFCSEQNTTAKVPNVDKTLIDTPIRSAQNTATSMSKRKKRSKRTKTYERIPSPYSVITSDSDTESPPATRIPTPTVPTPPEEVVVTIPIEQIVPENPTVQNLSQNDQIQSNQNPPSFFVQQDRHVVHQPQPQPMFNTFPSFFPNVSPNFNPNIQTNMNMNHNIILQRPTNFSNNLPINFNYTNPASSFNNFGMSIPMVHNNQYSNFSNPIANNNNIQSLPNQVQYWMLDDQTSSLVPAMIVPTVAKMNLPSNNNNMAQPQQHQCQYQFCNNNLHNHNRPFQFSNEPFHFPNLNPNPIPNFTNPPNQNNQNIFSIINSQEKNLLQHNNNSPTITIPTNINNEPDVGLQTKVGISNSKKHYSSKIARRKRIEARRNLP